MADKPTAAPATEPDPEPEPTEEELEAQGWARLEQLLDARFGSVNERLRALEEKGAGGATPADDGGDGGEGGTGRQPTDAERGRHAGRRGRSRGLLGLLYD